ncbi:hypothetical protein [Cupriavidus necator]|uniref:hypothetical protein n=1 Tax=Cupriavidus necator TaxID=106590 RepID=UPI00277FFA52|nr:hypothetical protein [Cupriavidus necator]MDQ0141358.1 hypothetical protein [Cupriavidus necator]
MAQRSLFAKRLPDVGSNIHRLTTKSGEESWFGNALNHMLVPQTESDGNRCVWSLAAARAIGAGLQSHQMPSLDAMFKHVASTIGGPNESRSSVPLNIKPICLRAIF